MGIDKKEDLYKQLREHQLKYIYFILAINASAIGYSVQLQIKSVNNLNLLLPAAILFWAISFFLCCQYLRKHMGMFDGKIKLIETPDNQELRNAMYKANKRGIREFNWSFYSLIIGVVIFIIWHFITVLYPNLKY